jgi:DeoR family transcriptional regulator of aga operon/DeoR family fructose operon transcriptional repressor
MRGLLTDRIEQIKKYIEQNEQVEVAEISKLFQVSIATARRDLDQLAEIGDIERIRGGARLARNPPPEPPVRLRRSEQAEEKLCIARATASLINDGETILMAGGTTVGEVANQLKERKNITVITNSLLVIEALANNRDIHLVTLGGFFRHTERLSYGHITEATLSEIYADKVIFGVRAISLERGLTNDYLPELSTDRLILRKGKEVIVVADYTKFNCESTSLVGPLSSIHKIVTDDKAPAGTVEAIRGMGIEVIIAT